MDNNKNSKYIVEQLSELRDLLIVIERSGEAAPDILYKLAIEKSQKITQLIEQRCHDVAPLPVEVPQEYEQWLDDATDETVVDAPVELPCEVVEPCEEEFVPEEPVSQIEVEEEPRCEVSDDFEIAIDEAEEYVAPFVEDEIAPQQAVESTPAEEAMPQNYVEEVEKDTPAEEVEEVPHDDIVVEHDNLDISIEEDVADVVTVDEVEEVGEVNEVGEFVVDDCDEVAVIADEEVVVMDDASEEESDDDTFYNCGEPLDSEPLTVGEMMSMRQARELRKALSLNDRFRFRRELFGNSDINMNDTLNLIDTMSDYNEANEYLLQDLGWSVDEPVVQEFLKLVELHFKQK